MQPIADGLVTQSHVRAVTIQQI